VTRLETLPRLMLVTDRRRTGGRDLVAVAGEAVQGGAGLVQLREKDLPEARLEEILVALRRALPSTTPVLVNGRVALARAAADGLHLPAAQAWPGPPGNLLVGRSAHDVAEARRAVEEGVGYLVLGPIFPTASKPGHPGHGRSLLRRVVDVAEGTPIFAIGGITPRRIPEVMLAGAYGVAVCGAILSAGDPRGAAEALARALDRHACDRPR
jgi:thiamine-phosphate pyrophosphorylase